MAPGKEARSSSPVKQTIATYLHAAGIQAGYTFFAPNVLSHYGLTLELFYGDEHVESIGFMMACSLFALVMIVMNLAAFGVPITAGEHRRLQQLPGNNRFIPKLLDSAR
jgi:hypothetical protein